MKKTLLLLLILFSFLTMFAETGVQSLAVGRNVLIGGPGKVIQIEAVGESASGSIAVKRVIDTWTYGTAAQTVTNSFTNSVSWATETVTNRVVSFVDDWLVVTNAVHTNVVRGVTNVVCDTTRRSNGSHPVTNEVVTVRPVWTTSYAPLTTSTVTNDVVSHAIYTNSVGTIALSNHVGSLAPESLYFTAGDVLVIESDSSATLRLYFDKE